MKFFSLSKEDIITEEGKKIISKEKIAKLVEVDEIIEKAALDAKDQIQQAKQEATEIKKKLKKKDSMKV
jgi:hypothetical protein